MRLAWCPTVSIVGRAKFSGSRQQRWFSTKSKLVEESSWLTNPAMNAQAMIRHAKVQGDGKYVDVTFSDSTSYRFHSAWLKDSSVENVGPDSHRTSVTAVWDVPKSIAKHVLITGDTLRIMMDDCGEIVLDANCMRAWGPFVGKPLNEHSESLPMTSGTTSLLDPLMPQRKPWTASKLDIPTFDAKRLLHTTADIDYQIAFLENMIDPGLAMVKNMGAPESMDRSKVGKQLDDLILGVVGKMNAHPIRDQRYGVIQKKKQNVINQGKDYNHSDPLSMHTDHSPYNGIPGFLQFMYQAEGSVTSKVCDGLAVAQHFQVSDPRAFEILCNVEFTHAIRNALYTKEGKLRDLNDPQSEPWEFELVHTHPILQMKDGYIERVVQSESKRGICSFQFDQYEEILQVYIRWIKLCEDPTFVKTFHWPEHTAIVTNNWRVLHGRASVPPEVERTMVFGYTNRNLVDNRYRLLKMKQYARDANVAEKFMMRNPNQVLMNLMGRSLET